MESGSSFPANHPSEHRPTFWTVLTRFGDAKRRHAGGETFGTVHFRKTPLPFLNPNSTESVLFGPYVLQLVNQSDPLRGRGVPPISNKKQIICCRICFIFKTKYKTYFIKQNILFFIRKNKLFCFKFCFLWCFGKKQILKQNNLFFKIMLKNKLFCFIICFLLEGGALPPLFETVFRV